MRTVTVEQAKNLAVRYCGYQEAKDDSSIVLWAGLLKEIQTETGVFLTSMDTLDNVISNHTIT
jgi:hypothetical protein